MDNKMSFWHREQFDFCGLDDGDVIIILTTERKLVLAELSHDWHLGTIVNPVTGEEYTDEVCEYRLTEYGGYDWIDTQDILCWAFMDDLYKFLPTELALNGAPDLGFL